MTAIPTFDEWVAAHAIVPRSEWTFGQYANYIEGWRNSVPWAYRGMSLAYDGWAETKWEELQDAKSLREYWNLGLGMSVKAFRESGGANWAVRATAQECADFIMFVFGWHRLTRKEQAA